MAMTSGRPAPDFYDPGDPVFVADPYPVYQRLRREAPVCYLADHDVWVVTRYDDAVAVLREPQLFSSERGMGAAMGLDGPPIRFARRSAEADEVARAQREAADLYGMLRPGMRILIASDPPDHTRLRRLVARPFSLQAVNALAPRVRELCEQLVDDLVDANEAGRADLVRHLAYPLPVIVIAELLGIEPERRDEFKQWSDDMVGGLSGDLDPQRTLMTAAAMFQYFSEVIEERRRAPRDDVISRLVNGDDDDPLNIGELIAFCLLLLIAGNETTTNLVGNGAMALLGDPDQCRRLRDDPGLIPGAVEEALRYDAPVQGLFRATTGPAVVGGVDLPEGARLLVAFASANRDEAHYEAADSFLVDRNPRDHLGFGAGIHLCLGAHLARLEARVAAETVLRRVRNLELRGEPTRVDSTLLRGFTHLPVRFDAA